MDELYYIYKKDGSRIRIGGTDVEPKYLSVKQLQYDGTFLGQEHISFTIKSPIAIPFSGQEYITVDGETYTLKYIPSFKKQARPKEYSESFVYDNIIMQSQIDDTTRVDFLDYVLDDNTIHYSAMPTVYFYGTVIDLAKRIQANLDRVYTGDKKWTVKLPTDTSTLTTVEKQITYQNKKVWDVITDIWNQYKVMFYHRGRTLYIGYTNEVISQNFKYGIGCGLKSLKRNTDESNKIITRLHAYGSTVNIPNRYYNTLGTSVKSNLPVTGVTSDGKNQLVWFKMKDSSIPMDMFKTITDFSFTGTGPTSDTDNTPITKTVIFSATKTQYTVSEGTVLSVDCSKWTYGDYRWLYWALKADGANVTITSSVVISYVPEEYLSYSNKYVSESMYLPNLMLTAIRTVGDVTIYYDSSFNVVTDETKAVYKMVKTGNNTKGLDIYLESICGIEKYGVLEDNITFDNNSDNNIIDLVDDENGIHPTLTKLTNSDGSSACKVVSSTQMKDSGLPNSAGTLDIATFEIVVNTGFNPAEYIISGETPKISMKSGMCIGREFEFNCSANSDGTYTLTCNRIIDSAIGIGFPNSDYNIKAGDTFVLIGIQLPEEYIVSAENRVLSAGLKYLSKFDHTKNTYTPELDNIFLNTNTSIRNEMRIGSMFMFTDNEINGTDANNQNIIVSLPISQLTIKIGYSLIREYSITLADSLDLSSDVVQRTLNAVQSYFSSNGSSGLGYSQVSSIAYSALKDKFLSKEHDDKTNYSLGIGNDLEVNGVATFGGSAKSKNYADSILSGIGKGWDIGADGRAQMESLILRSFLEVPEVKRRRETVIQGDLIQSCANGKIESVTIDKDADGNQLASGTIVLHIDDNDVGTLEVDDICLSIFSNLSDTSLNATITADDGKGNRTVKGFATSMFRVTEVSGQKNEIIKYVLRAKDGNWTTLYHPQSLATIAQRGNFTNTDRQALNYYGICPKPYIRIMHDVNSWEFTVGMIGTQIGCMENMSAFGIDMTGYSGYMKNIYFDGTIKQIEILGYDIKFNTFGDNMVKEGQTKKIKATVVDGWGADKSSEFDTWKLTRDTGNEAADNIWNASAEITNGVFYITWSSSKDDIVNDSALYTVTAEKSNVASSAVSKTIKL